MTRASISRRTSGAGAGAAALEIITGAAKGFWLRQVDFTLVAATASVYALGRPAAKGITPTTPVLFPPNASGDPTTITAASVLAWGTGPTVPTVFYRQNSLAAAIGQQTIWANLDIWIPVASTIVLWNVAANSVADVNIIIDEV